MNRETIKSALIDLLDDGSIVIEDGRLLFDGEPLEDNTPGEYDKNGWSIETSYGCRRHRAIDEFIERLARGDEHERRVANEADIWFCFNPKETPHLVADDEEEAKMAARAYFNSNIMARWLGAGSRRDNAMDFRLKAERWEIDSDNYWFMPEAHAVVYAVAPESEAPDRWPEEHIADLKRRVELYRSGRDEQAQDWLEK